MFNIGLVSISIALSVLVLNLHFRGHNIYKIPKWIKIALLMDENKLEIMADAAHLEPSSTPGNLKRKSLNLNHGRYIETLAKQAICYQSVIQNLELIHNQRADDNSDSNNCENQKRKNKDVRGCTSSLNKRIDSISFDKRVDQIINIMKK